MIRQSTAGLQYHHLQGQYCSIDDMFCIPANYSKFNPPLNPPGEPPAEVQIGLDNFEILKIDDREFTIEINAYFIVKWRDKRIEVTRRNHLIIRKASIIIPTTSRILHSSPPVLIHTNGFRLKD